MNIKQCEGGGAGGQEGSANAGAASSGHTDGVKEAKLGVAKAGELGGEVGTRRSGEGSLFAGTSSTGTVRARQLAKANARTAGQKAALVQVNPQDHRGLPWVNRAGLIPGIWSRAYHVLRTLLRSTRRG